MNLPNLNATTPEKLFSDIMDYVEKADASVKAMDMAVLAGLDTAVDALCKRVLELAPEIGSEHKPQLQKLLARIEELQKNMMTAQGEVAGSIKSLNRTKKANNAYNKNKPEAS